MIAASLLLRRCLITFELCYAAREFPYLDRLVVGIPGKQVLSGNLGLRVVLTFDLTRLKDVIFGVEDIATISDHAAPLADQCQNTQAPLKSYCGLYSLATVY
jgi:hypothetical protein